MLQYFLDGKPWFRPKSHGFGAGLPIAWQGWAFLAAHGALIAGVAMLLSRHPVALALSALLIGLAPLPLYARKTEGGWRWRWGQADD